MRIPSMPTLRDHRGQAAVEFVLLFPLVLVLILSLVEFGLLLHSHITVNNSAREAARFAAVAHMPSTTPGTCGANSIEARAVTVSSNLIDCAEISIGYIERNAEPGYSRGDGVVVAITHDYELRTPLGVLLNMFSFGAIPTSMELFACSDTRLESPPANQAILQAATVECS